MPELDVWLEMPRHREGTVTARNLNGQDLWSQSVPAGGLFVHPSGDWIVLSWDGFEDDDPRTVTMASNGQVKWRTDQFGGVVTFAGDQFLVLDEQRVSWYPVNLTSEVKKSGKGRALSISLQTVLESDPEGYLTSVSDPVGVRTEML